MKCKKNATDQPVSKRESRHEAQTEMIERSSDAEFAAKQIHDLMIALCANRLQIVRLHNFSAQHRARLTRAQTLSTFTSAISIFAFKNSLISSDEMSRSTAC